MEVDALGVPKEALLKERQGIFVATFVVQLVCLLIVFLGRPEWFGHGR
jgi:hypothetical protein